MIVCIFVDCREHKNSQVSARRGSRQCRLRPLGLDESDNILGVRLFLRQITTRNVGAFAGEGDCGGAPDARTPPVTSAVRPSSFQPTSAPITLLAVVGEGIHFRGKARDRLGLLGKWRRRLLLAWILERRAIGHNCFRSIAQVANSPGKPQR
jgi:hypothetical protein